MHTIQNQRLSIVYGCWISAEFLITVLVWQGLKQTSVGQCILKTMKSNSVILPLLLELSVNKRYSQKFQSWDMLSPTMRLSEIISQDEWRLQARLPLADKMNHISDTLDVRVPSMRWALLLRHYYCYLTKTEVNTSKFKKTSDWEKRFNKF